ncbi:MAG: diaminopimelate dehydrogenase [Dehalococcoidales bacterium]|nr:diaminopimelate dehydrogenase [Dehalococcoidales bacterium]
MKIAILGYGNLGKGAEVSVTNAPDMELVGIFTQRDPASITTITGAPVYKAIDLINYRDKVDVLLLCGGSATDLPHVTPQYAGSFNVVDTFDNHNHINEHFNIVHSAALAGGHLALISTGWDPGMFSLARLYSASILPSGKVYTFWGKGVSQGHSDAIRRIPGVKDARQYTIPIENAMEAVRKGENPSFTARQKHLRQCYVVAEDGADKAAITEQIKTMPDYFEPYDTTVEFVTEEELLRDHGELPHGGAVIHSGTTGPRDEHKETIEYKLTLDSNPEFTASVMTAFARAVFRMYQRGSRGCISVFDVAPADLSLMSPEEMRKNLL